MRLALIADTDQPGLSGVGDYTLLLADRLQARDVTATVFPLGDSVSSRRKEWFNQVTAYRPDWVSFQFVPYAYARRGLVTANTLPWESLRGSRATHFMFHEIWIGSHQGASLRDRVIGLLQRRGIRSVMRALRPSKVNCSNRLYSSLLTHADLPNKILPMFGTIPLVPCQEDPYVALTASLFPGGSRNKWTVAAFFGAIHGNSNALKVLRWLQETAQRHDRRLLVVSLGHCPRAEEHFRMWSEALPGSGTHPPHFLVRGRMSSFELSDWIGGADCGISTTPHNIIEKSSSAAAFAERGVPVLVTDRGAPLRHADVASADLAPRFWLADESTLRSLSDVPARHPGGSMVDDVAAMFLKQLEGT